MIIGISGWTENGGSAGAGKDTLADFFVGFGFTKIAFADPLKRICRDVYGFTDHQLWGPSELRNAPDHRYPRARQCVGWEGGHTEIDHLTPREALQTLGTEWGRKCYADTWVDYGLRMARAVEGGALYEARRGIVYPDKWIPSKGAVFSDVRFKNEVAKFREAGAKLIRIKRGTGLGGAFGEHRSETEQQEIPDSAFDVVVNNHGTLEDLKDKARSIFDAWRGGFETEKEI